MRENGMADHGDHETHVEHVRGTMDISDHERVFEGFLRFWVYVFGGAIAILIFLALFNS